MGTIANQVIGEPPAGGDAAPQTALIGVGSLWFAIAQAACATSVFLKSIAVLLGVSVVSAAAALEFLHQPVARLILLLFALSGAATNLYLVFKTWRLRRSPAARWRMRPMSPAERRRLAIAVSTSLLTFMVLGVEVWAHLLLHPMH